MDAQSLPPDRSSGGCYKIALSQLWMLMWKNLLLRRYHACITCCEICCAPVFVAVFIVPHATHLVPTRSLDFDMDGEGDGDDLASLRSGDSFSPHIMQSTLISALARDILGTQVAYSPKNPLTDEIIQKLSSQLTQDQDNIQWSGYKNEEEIEDASVIGGGKKGDIRMAIVFQDGFTTTTTLQNGNAGGGGGGVRLKPAPPPGSSTISYKLRRKSRSSSSREDIFKSLFFSIIFPHDAPSSRSRSRSTSASASQSLLGLQILLDRVLISQLSNQNQLIKDTISVQGFPSASSEGRGVETEGSSRDTWGKKGGVRVLVARGGRAIKILKAGNGLFIVMLSLCFCTIVPGVLREVVDEKASGVKELMRMMGLRMWMHWTIWMIDSLLTLSIPITIVVIILSIPISPGMKNQKEESKSLKLVHPTLNWFIFFSYAVAGTSFCFFISSFFKRPLYAVAAGIFIWLITSFIPLAFDEDRYKKMSLTTKFSICLVPNFALSFADKIINSYNPEKWDPFAHPNQTEPPPAHPEGSSASWGTLSSGVDSYDPLSLGHVLGAMYLSALICCILTVYLENVLPSEFGVRKPLYYPLLPSTWWHRKVVPEMLSSAEIQAQHAHIGDDPNFEEEPTEIRMGVEVKHLRKVYGFGAWKKVAVADLTLNMYHGQITALLGHNGAGKTTTMSMLTGMTAPTSGTAVINGYDMNKNMDSVRENLGFCPQQNMLFNNLTVEQHLNFFGRLKRTSRSLDVRLEMQDILAKLELQDKAKSRSCQLSGGQKRKLQLAIALIGSSKVVILDEPTSGLDPEARRNIWNLLQVVRKDRTIMLTTHYMEEADVLADRIGIMSDGHLECCGSSMFLKLRYGAGYTLSLIMQEEPAGKPEEVFAIVHKNVQNATIKSKTHQKSGMEIAIILPSQAEARVASVFPKMFKELEDKKTQLGIKHMSISFTTMDDVFVKVDELHYKKNPTVAVGQLLPLPPPANEDQNGEPDAVLPVVTTSSQSVGRKSKKLKHEVKSGDDLEEKGQYPSGSYLPEAPPPPPPPLMGQVSHTGSCICQFWALQLKMLRYKRRKWGQLLYQLSIVIAPFLLVVLVAKIGEKSSGKLRLGAGAISTSRSISLSQFENPAVLHSSNDQTVETDYVGVVGQNPNARLEKAGFSSGSRSGQGLAKAFLSSSSSGKKVDYIVGAELEKGADSVLHINALFSPDYQDSAFLAVNLATNTLLRQSIPSANANANANANVSIGLSYEELPSKSQFGIGRRGRGGSGDDSGLAISVQLAIFLPIGIFLQGGSFILPPVEERHISAKQVQLMTGVCAFSYWFSFFLIDFVQILIVSVVTSSVFLIVPLNGFLADFAAAKALFLIVTSFGFSAIWLSYLFSIRFSVGNGFASTVLFYIFTGFVAFLFIFLEFLVVYTARGGGGGGGDGGGGESSFSLMYFLCTKVFPAFGTTNGILLFSLTMIRNWDNHNCRSKANPSDCDSYTHFLTWGGTGVFQEYFNVGIGQMCFWMVLNGVFYMLLLFLIECRLCASKSKDGGAQEPDMDPDVYAETARVLQAVSAGRGASQPDALLAVNLRKTFKKQVAVSNVTFGVHPGECFGLLGTNGAGKTTTFRMLTGDVTPSFGNAILPLIGAGLVESRSDYLSALGYCPQFDGIIGVLTGREMLLLFATLRGVPRKHMKEHTELLLSRSGLEESGNVECRKYSGGMKRRLTTALALVGDPPIILLDEPTAGVDPVARRHFWKIIGEARAAGHSVVLTSHSMEECEAVCSRLGIMVDGKMQCLGTVNYLKNKFAQGYNLNIRLNVMLSTEKDAVDPPDVAELLDKVLELLSPCTLKDKHQSFLEFHLVNTSVSLGDLFKSAEELKELFGDLIVDYSVTETTLEDVFISFARRNYGNNNQGQPPNMPIQGQGLPDPSYPMQGQGQTMPNYPMQGQGQPMSNYPMQGQGQPMSNYPMQGQGQPTSYYPMQGQGQPMSTYPMQGQGQPMSNYPMQGQGQPMSNYPMQGQGQLGPNYPMQGQMGSNYQMQGQGQMGTNYPMQGQMGSNYQMQGQGQMGTNYPMQGQMGSNYQMQGQGQMGPNYPMQGQGQLGPNYPMQGQGQGHPGPYVPPAAANTLPPMTSTESWSSSSSASTAGNTQKKNKKPKKNKRPKK